MYNCKKTNQDITNGERLQELLGIQIRDNKKLPSEFILFDLEANSNLSSGTIKYKFSYNVDGVVKYFYVTINIKL